LFNWLRVWIIWRFRSKYLLGGWAGASYNSLQVKAIAVVGNRRSVAVLLLCSDYQVNANFTDSIPYSQATPQTHRPARFISPKLTVRYPELLVALCPGDLFCIACKNIYHRMFTVAFRCETTRRFPNSYFCFEEGLRIHADCIEA
jgi:hypothetical protein